MSSCVLACPARRWCTSNSTLTCMFAAKRSWRWRDSNGLRRICGRRGQAVFIACDLREPVAARGRKTPFMTANSCDFRGPRVIFVSLNTMISGLALSDHYLR